MGERAVFSTMAHVFQIDQETKKRWIPLSSSSVKVSYYHDPARKTYRIITIDNSKALVNSTITANMNFTKTSPKFGQWSDHRANTVFGLGFSSENDLIKFIDMFNEAKQAARELMKERQLTAQRLQDQDKPHPPAGSALSPTSLPIKSPPPLTSPPSLNTSSALKSPPPSQIPDLSASEDTLTAQKTSSINNHLEKEEDKSLKSGSKEQENEGTATTNGSYVPPVEPLKMSNGHSSSETSPDGKLDSLKTENNRLKLALASSGTNVKKWESEMQTLKNNNTRLQTALEESKVNVSQWKAQLQRYKEENDSLKKKIQQLEGVRKKESTQNIEEMAVIRKENEELKEVLSDVQIDLESKTEDAHTHARRADSTEEKLQRIESKLEILEEDKQDYISQIAILEDQLKMSSVASKRKIEEFQIHHKDIGQKLRDLLELHTSLESHLEV